ncbi:hypothetical protein L3V16_22825 [Brucella ciceri]|uniref:hypothetical protein n=1 Tax=Brucella ciceri TaxID=391287 RepID=UPI000DE25730|nr:hypothetical protein [Brucella ciceri]MCH6206658.1 hypothetical protein [Brucella ciceri]
MRRSRKPKKVDIVSLLLLASIPAFVLTVLVLLSLAKEKSPAAIISLVDVQNGGQTEIDRGS